MSRPEKACAWRKDQGADTHKKYTKRKPLKHDRLSRSKPQRALAFHCITPHSARTRACFWREAPPFPLVPQALGRVLVRVRVLIILRTPHIAVRACGCSQTPIPGNHPHTKAGRLRCRMELEAIARKLRKYFRGQLHLYDGTRNRTNENASGRATLRRKAPDAARGIVFSAHSNVEHMSTHWLFSCALVVDVFCLAFVAGGSASASIAILVKSVC
jgi:hypothetical protein